MRNWRLILMLILKLTFHLATSLLTFVLGLGIVTGFRYMILPATVVTAENHKAPPAPNAVDPDRSGIYFVAPSINVADSNCANQNSEIYPFGWDSYLQTNQMPHIRRMARDGRWFYFETEANNGRSYEFFGIVPSSVVSTSQNGKVAIMGKLVRLTNGDITGNVDATYYVSECVFK